MNRNAPFFKKLFYYISLYGTTAFGFNFGPRERPTPKNARKRKCMFPILGTYRGQKFNLKAVFLLSPV